MEKIELILTETLEDISLWSWIKYQKTRDNNFFIVDYDGRQPKVTDEDDIKRLTELEDKIVTDYFEALDDNTYQLRLQKMARLELINVKYITVMILLDRMSRGFGDSKEQLELRHEYISRLDRLGFKMNKVNSVQGDMESIIRLSKEVEGLKNKANLLIAELQVDGKQEESNINKQLIQFSRILELGYRLDPKEITLMEYVQYIKLVQEKINEQKK